LLLLVNQTRGAEELAAAKAVAGIGPSTLWFTNLRRKSRRRALQTGERIDCAAETSLSGSDDSGRFAVFEQRNVG
jgi:hypothetical protein